MPTNGAARATSALSGFGLLITAIVLAYLNSTTSNPLWSLIYFAGVGVVSLGVAAKWATAFGVENKLAVAGDWIASWLPWVALWFNGIQVLSYNHDGLDGFMAGIAFIGLMFCAGFGLLDSVTSIIGKKYKNVAQSMSEARERVIAANEALHRRQGQ